MSENFRPSLQTNDNQSTVTALIGLGSNIGDATANIDDAIARLRSCNGIHLLATSRYYRSAPWGVTDQAWFANACIGVQTGLAPHDLLRCCQAVERDMGRVRQLKWGPRVIDVDILTYGDTALTTPDLVIPHPLIAERGFVLKPLRDIAPSFELDGRSIADMLQAIAADDVVVIDDAERAIR